MLIIDSKANNNKHSGGFPHSEIHGSKLILSSPWLIAEYHVFHRLLLPRHSPNALFALDLIQKKSDLRLQITRWFTYYRFLWAKVILSRLNTCRCIQTVNNIAVALVSVLDLDNSVHFNLAYVRAAEETAGSKRSPRGKPRFTRLRSSRYSGQSNSVDICISLNDVKDANKGMCPIGRLNTKECLTVKSV